MLAGLNGNWHNNSNKHLVWPSDRLSRSSTGVSKYERQIVFKKHSIPLIQ